MRGRWRALVSVLSPTVVNATLRAARTPRSERPVPRRLGVHPRHAQHHSLRHRAHRVRPGPAQHEQALERRRSRGGASDEHLERLKARVAAEYAAFRKAAEEWNKVREEWVADRKQRLLQRWEETSFRLRLKQIEQGMRMQRRRLRAMSKAYA